jgi:peptide/nickel transport system permease protein
MANYIIRRLLFAIPILICINLIIFLLFFYVNSTDDVAYAVLNQKNTTVDQVYSWKRQRDYHLPRLLNLQDRIIYVTKQKEVAADIVQVLEGYTITPVVLDAQTLQGEIETLKTAQEKRPEERRGELPLDIDAVNGLITKVKESMDGDEIVLIDPAGLTKEEAGIVRNLLERGVPFIVLKRAGVELPVPLQLSVVLVLEVGADTAAQDIKELRDYIDTQQATGLGTVSRTLFFQKSVRLFWFQFGKSDSNNLDISDQVFRRMGPSLLITIPVFLLGMFINIFIAMIVAYTRGTYVDRMMAVVCIFIMSVLSLFYYFSAQLVFGTWLKIFPVSGYLRGFSAMRFVMLPVVVSLFIGIGGGVRFYRTIFLEEVNREYVRTARSKGLSEFTLLFKHVLKNAMIPILTNAVMVIPMLFVGSLILENFFGIPGLGGFTLEGIQAQDFRIVGSMVYLGSFLGIMGLIMTDISYTLVDPRVRLE